MDIIAKDSANNKVLFPTFCVQMDPNISATVSCSTGPTGIVTTLAGTGGSGTNDGSFSVATFNQPQGITAIGNALYIVDTGNSRIRKLDLSTQAVSTLAGSTNGYTNATGVAAQFFNPRGATTDGTNLYVVDRDNYAIRLINPSTGAVTTFAGPLIPATSGLANGVGTAARFNAPDYIFLMKTIALLGKLQPVQSLRLMRVAVVHALLEEILIVLYSVLLLVIIL